jgi:serine/threonine protein kinase
MKRSDTIDVKNFIEAHSALSTGGICRGNELIGGWRVTALLGRGGNGEVYRVVRAETGEAAALKISSKKHLSARRIVKEAGFLESGRCPYFPRLIERGEHQGLPYFVMELLEPLELPYSDRSVADLILKLSSAVLTLHRLGFVHRDIKPANIMLRTRGDGGTEPVLIDLGLLKKYHPLSDASSVFSATLVDGAAVGAGTPRYAAPEQFGGGDVSPSADIHALGVLINECFKGRPPGPWEKIVSRATSSIPERRYGDIADLVKAVSRRNRGRKLLAAGTVAAVVAAATVLARIFSGVGGDTATMSVEAPARSASVQPTFGEDAVVDVVDEELVSVAYATNRYGIHPAYFNFRRTTNRVEALVLRLEGGEKTFERPVALDSRREYRIIGPGTLNAALQCPQGVATVRLERCVFNNRSAEPPKTAGIYYVLDKGARLNFTEHDMPGGVLDFFRHIDGAYSSIRFKDSEAFHRKRVADMLKLDSKREN